VSLYKVEEGKADALLGTTVTDQDGNFLFTGLLSARYYLKFQILGELVFTDANQGTDDTLDSDPDTTSGATSSFWLSAGEVVDSFDAGLRLHSGKLPSITIDDVVV